MFSRLLGVPRDPVAATDYLAARLRSSSPRRMGLGQMADRYFLFCCGMGLDAEVVRRVEADVRDRGRKSHWTFVKHTLAAGTTEYRTRRPVIDVEVAGRPKVRALFVVCGNARPFTYFKGLPIDAHPTAGLERALDLLSLKKLTLPMIPRLIFSLFVSRSHIRWRSTDYFPDFQEAHLRADHPDPVQVDGDYVGELNEARIRYIPDAVSIYA